MKTSIAWLHSNCRHTFVDSACHFQSMQFFLYAVNVISNRLHLCTEMILYQLYMGDFNFVLFELEDEFPSNILQENGKCCSLLLWLVLFPFYFVICHSNFLIHTLTSTIITVSWPNQLFLKEISSVEIIRPLDGLTGFIGNTRQNWEEILDNKVQ